MKKKIDHTNYEAWLLDRLESNLAPEQERELDEFLAANPDLASANTDLPYITDDHAGLNTLEKNDLKRWFPPLGVVSSHTLEDHLIARLEGDLSPEQRVELEKFLYEHPEHSRTAVLYDHVRIARSDDAFPLNSALHRTLPPVGVDRYTLHDHLIAKLEGDLSSEQEKALQAYLRNDPEARRELRLLELSRIGREDVIYDRKDELKKEPKIISISGYKLFVRIAAAASIALLLGAGVWFLQKPVETTEGSVAVIQEEKPAPATTVENDPIDASSSATSENSDPIEASEPVSPAPRSRQPHSIQKNQIVEPSMARVEEQREVDGPNDEVGPGMPLDQLANSATPVPDPSTDPQDQEDLANVETVDPSTGTEPAQGIGSLVAATFRERVLSEPAADDRPLDAADAVAVVDRGLKAVGGSETGVTVDHTNGKIQRIGLRLGRNFAITASTGR